MNGRTQPQSDVIVIGAGFAGLYMLHRLRTAGFTVRLFERGEDVGGTWFWNRYPGARCDIESIDYSYSFDEQLQQEWEWSERFATQPEILSYLRHVADRFSLHSDITLSTGVTAAEFDEANSLWRVTTDDSEHATARHLVLCVGNLSEPHVPPIPGIDSFGGRVLQTSRWPEEGVDFTARRVGVMGTGSSGVQAIPRIAEQARSVTVFQRTPNFSVPARNRRLAPGELAQVKTGYASRRARARRSNGGVPIAPPSRSITSTPVADVQRALEDAWDCGGAIALLSSFNDIMVSDPANEIAAEFLREQIRRIVKNPEIAERLLPRGYPLGAKRLTVGTDYYETFNREHVSLVDVTATPIERVCPEGVMVDDRLVELDDLVMATGFDAVTGAILGIDIRGRAGERLSDAWADGPRTHLGMATPRMPNMFIISGPGSPAIITNVIAVIEHNVEWVAQTLEHARVHRWRTIEAAETSARAWMDTVHALAAKTLFPRGRSWYSGQNIEGKPAGFTAFVGGIASYSDMCEAEVAEGFSGFVIDGDTGTDRTGTAIPSMDRENRE